MLCRRTPGPGCRGLSGTRPARGVEARAGQPFLFASLFFSQGTAYALQEASDNHRRNAREHLAVYPDHYEVDFSGPEFYRLKQRGPELVQVEFSEQVYRDKTGRVVVESPE